MNKSNEPDYSGLVAEAIAEHWGERCPDYAADCPTCQAWKQFDDLRTLLESNAALERERDAAREALAFLKGEFSAMCRRAESAEAKVRELLSTLLENAAVFEDRVQKLEAEKCKSSPSERTRRFSQRTWTLLAYAVMWW